MITGSEEITCPLTDHEREVLLPLFIAGLSRHVGKENPVTSAEIIAAMGERGHKVSGGRVRKVINHIRIHALLPMVLADTNGYWVSDDMAEVALYVRSLKDREDAIRAMRVAIQQQAETKWQHQFEFA